MNTNKKYLSGYPDIIDTLHTLKEVIISNIVMIGQEPMELQVIKDDDVAIANRSPRAAMFSERIGALSSVDECTTDSDGNPVALIKGRSPGKKPIIVCAHLDTTIKDPEDPTLWVTDSVITGPGIADNTVSAGALASLPEILEVLNIHLESDLYIVGLSQSLGKKNLTSARQFIANWRHQPRGAVILEGIEIGRLNYYSLGMVRAEITCQIPAVTGWEHKGETNTIIIFNEIINRIMAIEVPQRPKTRINIGRLDAGLKYGDTALTGTMGFEVVSDSLAMVDAVYGKIEDIVESIAYESQVTMQLKKQSNVGAYSLGYNHPLVKSAVSVMEELNLKPKISSSESELAVFLARQIPTITVGLTHGENVHKENASVEIEPMFKGIAQIIGILLAIDGGVCDEN
ncbi:MAG: M20/M25/M40 family metallo-hydrolase [Spirochaetales bacterium]|nr:M20/M25/M40 family metallo-hydrolase [Spirochaetales bacterium]